MLTRTQDNEEIIERVAALDIGKAGLVCCVRVPDEDHPGGRLQEVETYPTLTRPLLSMADRLACLGVTRVVMEARRTTCDVRVHEFKWEAPLEARLMPGACYPGQCALDAQIAAQAAPFADAAAAVAPGGEAMSGAAAVWRGGCDDPCAAR